MFPPGEAEVGGCDTLGASSIFNTIAIPGIAGQLRGRVLRRPVCRSELTKFFATPESVYHGTLFFSLRQWSSGENKFPKERNCGSAFAHNSAPPRCSFLDKLFAQPVCSACNDFS